MNFNLSWKIFICCFFISVTLFAQKRKINSVKAQKSTEVSSPVLNQTAVSLPDRKIMVGYNKLVWVFPTNTLPKGHWERARVGETEKHLQQMEKGDSLYPRTISGKTYKDASRHSSEVPKKAFEINKFEEHPYISNHPSQLVNKGAVGKTNVYYYNSIDLTLLSFAGYNKYDLPETNRGNTDHILVTDTLIVGPNSLGIMDLQRQNRGYIKIIANCIIYESPLKASSTIISSKTDFVFSAKNIFFKSPYNDLSDPKPPFFWKMDSNVEVYVDPFEKNESLLLNRLLIKKLALTLTELQNPNTESWAKDKLLESFQKLRGRVDINFLSYDDEQLVLFNKLCDNFNTNYSNKIIKSERSIGDMSILVEGDINNLIQEPLKYFALPTKAVLAPVKNESTGNLNILGNVYYQATGDSNLSLTLEAKLGYDEEIFKTAANELKKKGIVLELNPPKSALFIEEQPLKINGNKVGKIIPISDQILRLKIDLNDQGLSLVELFPSNNNIRFNVFFKAYDNLKEIKQEFSLYVPKELLEEIDYENMISNFNVIESNTLTDNIRITSELSPSLNNDSGALNYIEIYLEFLFDDQKVVYRGPFRMSSFSVLASVKDISFIKHSENFKVKLSGTAYYEFDTRDIKDNSLFEGKFIVIEESLFKNE